MREEGWPHSQLFPFMNMIHIGVSYFLTGFPYFKSIVQLYSSGKHILLPFNLDSMPEIICNNFDISCIYILTIVLLFIKCTNYIHGIPGKKFRIKHCIAKNIC